MNANSKINAISGSILNNTTSSTNDSIGANAPSNNIIQGNNISVDNDNIQSQVLNIPSPSDIHKVKYPAIRLPTFDGAYSRWLEFRDAFTALVHDNRVMNDIEKFYYLKSSLQDEAGEIIQSIEVSSANYQIAWQLLNERFENKRLIIFNHIRAIFDYPSLQKENHSDLRKLFDNITKNLRSLKTLKQPVDTWDTLIIFIFSSKIDPRTRREWESYDFPGELPTINDMNTFLKRRCELLEKLEYNSKENIKVSKYREKSTKTSQSNSYVANVNKLKCYFCNGQHIIYSCDELLKLSIDSRINELKKKHLCLNCLRPGHLSPYCKYYRCKQCNRKHNTLLHITSPETNFNETGSNDNSQESISQCETQTLTSHVNNSINSQILLPTAIILVEDYRGQFHKARALLDSASQSSFITDELCNKLCLKKQVVNIAVKGVGESLAGINHQVTISFKSCHSSFKSTTTCLILQKITEQLPCQSFAINQLEIPSNIQLADPTFYKRNKIDILLGANLFWDLISIGQLHLGRQQPILQKTLLGWIVSGSLCHPNKVNYSISCSNIQLESSIDNLLTQFWKIEEFDNSKKNLTDSERMCESHFINNFERNNDGRFIVKMPLKENFSNQLGDSRKTALNRYFALERKLDKNYNLKSEYIAFMREYQNLGHMTRIDEQLNNCSIPYYLPHHAVVKESSLTTKVRVVFDASAKTDNGISLNDLQYCGPTIQSDLFSILIRFRQYKYIISADVSKMYRQILIHEEQRHLQRIFWRENSTDELQCFQLNTVTYGTTSAPFLAVRCLYELAIENEAQYPLASRVIKNDFYVDDLLTGSNSISEFLSIQKDVSSILLSGGFELRKWLSNNFELLNKFHICDNSKMSILPLGQAENNKTLGILWNALADQIQYSIYQHQQQKIVTKRIILSITSQIFDPLGLLGPIIIFAKLILQNLWRDGLTWDEAVSQKTYTMWRQFQNNLQDINDIKIPRFILSTLPINIELHGFSDSSESAYGACVYVRCQDASGSYSSNLLCAKSRVAPLKQISLPRLELCGANLLAHLVEKILKCSSIKFRKQYFWCDSTITLAWIKGSARHWKTFVANRVGEIQTLTDPADWSYVKSSENPADLISRGMNAREMMNSSLWWHGPQWLLLNADEWNITNFPSTTHENIPEKRTISVATTIYHDFNLFEKYSCIFKLQRVVAYCFRFFKNAKLSVNNRQFGNLTLPELEFSLNILIKISQYQAFPQEYNDLYNNKPINKNSCILSLSPYMDDNKIIRVGGRINNSNFEYNKKHPIIIGSSHKLTSLILSNEHLRLGHCGPQQLLSSIRERYWPLSGRNIARKITRNCVTCFRAKPSSEQYLMGNLPKCRVTGFHPFSNVGIDYGGPILIKDRKLRGAKLLKAYICLFICMSTKAVHLDIVTDLSTNAFMSVLRRFIGRRGRPDHIYSDNSTTFVGANSQLKDLYKFLISSKDEISNNLSKESIYWHFIPPRSPNFGGIWEAGIKSTKYHLKRIVGNLNLTYEDLMTVLIQIEAILNSRPLSPLSSDPTDVNPLTPSHFLIGKSLTALPESKLPEVETTRLRKYEILQQAIQHFWKRWQREYIGEWQTRVKWKTNFPNLLKVGSLVLIKEDNLPPLKWRMGRVVKLHSGKDDIIRVATMRLSNGSEIQRVVSKLCVLPINNVN